MTGGRFPADRRPTAAAPARPVRMLRAAGVIGAAVLAAAAFAPSALAPTPAAALSTPQDALFDEGNRLYQDGDFGGAAASYEAILAGGFESAEVYYNLGNAHFRLGSVGLAVLNYERAARLDPRSGDIQANLELVGQMLQDRIEPLPRFWVLSVIDWWMTLIPRERLGPLVALCYLALGVATVLLVLGRPRGWHSALRRAVYASLAATVLLGGTLLARETGLGQPEEAVVMASEARVLSAPSEEGGLTVFTVHEGTRVRIDRRAEDWAEIVLADGKVGWLPLAAIEII